MQEKIRIEDLDIGKSLLVEGDNLEALKLIFPKYKGKVDLIYIDPPYNTSQVFTFTNGRQNTISRGRNGKIAYSDNLSLKDYLFFLEERLLLLRDYLSEQGSIYLHIDYKVGHYVKVLMDKIFGVDNFKNDITRIKSNPKNFERKAWGNEKDMILFYAKNYDMNIWNDIRMMLSDEEKKSNFKKKDSKGYYTTVPLHAPGETENGETGMEWRGMLPPSGRHWRVSPKKLDELDSYGMIEWSKNNNPRLKKYVNEHKGKKYQDVWCFKDPQNPSYPTEKNKEMLDLIIRQSSHQGSIILDCFCGSGSTLKEADKLGRRFVGIDNSSFAIEVTEEKLERENYQKIKIESGVKTEECANNYVLLKDKAFAK